MLENCHLRTLTLAKLITSPLSPVIQQQSIEILPAAEAPSVPSFVSFWELPLRRPGSQGQHRPGQLGKPPQRWWRRDRRTFAAAPDSFMKCSTPLRDSEPLWFFSIWCFPHSFNHAGHTVQDQKGKKDVASAVRTHRTHPDVGAMHAMWP